MRIALLLIMGLLTACSSPPQYLSDRGLGTEKVRVSATKTSLDDILIGKAWAANCQGIDQLDPNAANDGYFKVQARWSLLNCIHSNGKPRKLVVLLDGTANDKDDSTNIWQMYNMALIRSLADTGQGGEPVIAYYDKGVGTSPVTPISGAAFGNGVSINIRQAYRFLVEAYQPGDQIYLFGFSRGAFTARSLNGFIEFAGLAKFDTLKANGLDATPLFGWAGHMHNVVKDMYDLYHVKNTGNPRFYQDLRARLHAYRKSHGIDAYGIDADGNEIPGKQVVVKVIGVFDTVPAVGWGLDEDPDGHRLELYADAGYQAMSLDEQREAFRLLRFGVPQTQGQTLEEVWFAGVHADVGGGYLNKQNLAGCGKSPYGENPEGAVGLESIPLRWMLEKLKSEQLFPDDPWPPACIGAHLHDEYFDAPSALSWLYKNAGLFRRKPVEMDRVHISVYQRMDIGKLEDPHQAREPGGRYQPVNIGHEPLNVFRTAGADESGKKLPVSAVQ
ncbi:DUF2235 domain-containing protein [Pseudomonas sp. Irchel s3a18]|uniref:phospholipase effector Tle1 domain-containing protein n=1 Tax=Pseudomonas sp. Irchel s3a18 TaxID=2009053 RepID=UPI000BA43F7C|nr:DUF2235 domain-containing protein [Pseudomonas sp. Irchel s3a18]